MYALDERVLLVRRRARQLRRQRENRLLGGLSSLCAALSFALVAAFSGLSGAAQGGTVLGLYGATMMFEDAGGYVLVGLLCFAAAAVITLLCIRHREKNKENSKTREDENR